MAIQFPNNRKQVEDRARADVKSQLTTSNPWLKNSFLGALITGYAGRVYEFYLQLKNALLELFPDTASAAFLERWGSYVSITRNPATQSTGFVVFTGTSTTAIPAGTLLASSDGKSYQTDADGTISPNTVSITTLVRSGTVATATTTSEHNLASGMTVVISGADQAEYNLSTTINAISANKFSYSVAGSPTTPATGTILVDSTSAYVKATSLDYGSSVNQISGTQLTLSSVISGAASTVYVSFDELGGGSDLESDEAYRTRVLFRYQNPISLFNVSAIKTEVFKRTGVTRTWVFEAGSERDPISVSSISRQGEVATVTTATPHYLEGGQYATIEGATPSGYNGRNKVLPINDTKFAYVVDAALSTPATGTITAATSVPNGQVKIYFTRDLDASNIPSASEVNAVNAQVQTIRPANVTSTDVIVSAPVAVPVDFVFSSILPNTQPMRTAIENSLVALFSEQVNVGEALQSHAYIAAIWQTVDATGALVLDFDLSSPTADIAIAEGEIPTLGTITFN